MSITRTYAIDHDGDGVPEHTVECYPGATMAKGLDAQRPLMRPQAQPARIDIYDPDGIHSPEGDHSTPGQHPITVGESVVITAHLGGVDYPLYTGIVDEPRADYAKDRKALVLSCLDRLSRLTQIEVSTALYSTIRTDEAIEIVLDTVGWPTNILDMSFTSAWAGGSAFRYVDLTDVPDLTLGDDVVLEYEVYLNEADARIAVDLTTAGGATLRDSGSLDQNGLNAHPSTNLSAFALGQWYAREISVASALWGETVAFWDIACETDLAGVFSGRIRNIRIHHTPSGEPRQTVTILPSTASTVVNTAVHLNGQYTDHDFAMTLQRSLEQGLTTLDWWWLSKENAFSAIEALVNTEGPGAACYVDGDGSFVFHNRHHRMLATESTVTQATFEDGQAGVDMAYISPFGYDRRVKDVVNQATVTAKERSTKAATTLDFPSQTTVLNPGQHVDYPVTFQDPVEGLLLTDGPIGANPPTLTFHTDDMSPTSSGQTILFRLALPALASGPYTVSVGEFEVTYEPVTVDVETAVQNTVDASASIAQYGPRNYQLATRAEIDVNAAIDFCNGIVGFYKDERQNVAVTLTNLDDAIAEKQLTLNISDLVQVSKGGGLGMDRQFYVNTIRHQVGVNGAQHYTTLLCQVADGAAGLFLIIGSPTRGIIGQNVMGY